MIRIPTWQQLRDLKITEYEDAADGWGKVSHRADAARIRVDQEMSIPVRGTQKGETPDAAVGQLNRLSDNYQYLQSECGLIRTSLNALAVELAAPQRKLKQALEDAHSLGFTVKADGSVTYPNSAPLSLGTGKATPGAPFPLLPGKGEGQGNANKDKAEDLAERISTAVSEATSIDSRYAGVLRKLKASAGLAITKEMLADAGKDLEAVQKAAGAVVHKDDIPQGKTPAENKAWWDSLTSEQRDEYATLYPAETGALDGLPAVARDTSNRMVLAEAHAQAQADLAELGPEPQKYTQTMSGPVINPLWTAWDNKAGPLKGQIKGMDAIQARIDASGMPGEKGKSGLPQAYLLGFDTKGIGHAVIANGNPETADHTAVYVPGTTSNLEGIGGNINRATHLWQQAQAQAPGETTSTITWLGYDAPQGLVTDATFDDYAYDGAPKLNNFLDGLQVTQGGANGSHTTVIGHSYGSTVIGAAAMEHDLAADDVVTVGSPGVLVGSADDLDVGRDHVWSEAGSTDPVPALGRDFLAGRHWGVNRWNGIPYDAGYITSIPSDESFGAHRMDVDTGGHSDYWNQDSQSLKNQAWVVVGRYNRVEEAD
ncbi:alpha/beta hydrolase [Streptomyces sp. NPDC050485]|uniref:alpha/beta hydrolase n=1 Tax=Streptomyces sp. NPDC050485 TaxID=3365617 RepID=UPI00378F608A